MKRSDKKIALVVQRAGEDIVGGSEGYTLAMARILSEQCAVDILTTTAKDHNTWENAYPEGDAALSDTLTIRRFRVDCRREPIWFELNRFLAVGVPLDEFPSLTRERRKALTDRIRRLPLSFGEEWLRREGPYSSALLRYIAERQDDYRAFFFMTYLYATTYFGIEKVTDPDKIYFVPTFHDESPAYLPNFLKYKKYRHLFLTSAEKGIAEENLYGEGVKSNIIGFGIADRFGDVPVQDGTDTGPYILYAGRIEEAKGVRQLLEMFSQYSEENRSLKLYLIGDGHLKNYQHPNVVYKGFVDEDEKLRLMKNALAFVHPSAFESLGIVLLESFMMGTPAIVNSRSDVLQEHMLRSNAGYSYCNYDEFREALNKLLSGREGYQTLSARARDYFLTQYSLDAYKKNLLSVLNRDTALDQEKQAEVRFSFPGIDFLRSIASRIRRPTAGREELPAGQDHIGVPCGQEPRAEIAAAAFRREGPEMKAQKQAVAEHDTGITDMDQKSGAYSHPLALPAAETEQSIFRYLSRFCVEHAPKQEMNNYLTGDFRRFLYTLSILPSAGSGRLLEIGANPYYMSLLIKKFTKFDFSCTNYFGEGQPPESVQYMVGDADDKVEFKYRSVNFEDESVPYENGSFDVVLCCEVIEHMTKDPMRALTNIKRILKPGGHLILTTPNVSRLENVAKMLAGLNIYDPYSGYGVYGRHNREYNKHELNALLTHLGFDMEVLFSSDVHPDPSNDIFNVDRFRNLVEFRKNDLGQYIFLRAKNAREGSAKKPSWLYRSYSPEELCD